MKSFSVLGEKFFFWAGLIVFVSLHLIFYPPIFAFRDEASYLSMAYVFKHGKFFIDQTAVPFQSWIVSGGHKVFDYPLGMSAYLLPFTLFGWKAVFFAGLISHLTGTIYFGKILKLFKIENPALALLYLFYPAFIFYSRTIMSDIPASVLILMGAYYYFKSETPDWRAGVPFALSLLIRPAGSVYIAPFVLGGIWGTFREGKPKYLFLFIIPLFLSFVLIGLWQYYFYGSVFLSGYSLKFSTIASFLPAYFCGNFIHYLGSLCLSYPLLVFAPLAASKTRRVEIVTSAILGFAFFSFYYFHDHFQNKLQTSILGVRFLFPAVSFFLLMYAEILGAFLKKNSLSVRAGFSGILLAFLSLSALFINAKHQSALKEQVAMKEAIYNSTGEGSVLIYDTMSAELMQEAWGKRRYIDWRDGEHRLIDFLNQADFKKGVYLVSRGGRPGKHDLSWVSWDEMGKIQKDFDIRLKGKSGEVEIYQFYDHLH